MPSPDGTIEEYFSVEEFTEAMRAAITAGARIVGSCCGSGPEHTRALNTLL
jgi:methionine synthase I (cobalamin-dependent)